MIERMYEESSPDQLHIQRFLSANCFGDYYTRKGLDIKTRELLTFSLLIALGGTESQMKGHIRQRECWKRQNNLARCDDAIVTC